MTQSDVEKGLAEVHKKRCADKRWAIASSEVAGWCKTTGKRIRTILRHVAQAVYKSPTSDWFLRLGLDTSMKRPAAASDGPAADDEGEEEDDDVQEDEEEEEAVEHEEIEEETKGLGKKEHGSGQAGTGGNTKGAIEATVSLSFFVGYDKGTRTAWRCPHDKKKQKTLADSVIKLPGSSATSSPVACFPDGQNFYIQGMTCEELDGELAQVERHAAKKRKGKCSVEPLWEGVAPCGAPLRVQWRKDRPWVISIFKAKLQVCQVKPIVWNLEGKSETEKDDALVEVMVSIAKQWAEKVIDENSLFEVRDKLIEKMKFVAVSARKRPAAASKAPGDEAEVKEPAKKKSAGNDIGKGVKKRPAASKAAGDEEVVTRPSADGKKKRPAASKAAGDKVGHAVKAEPQTARDSSAKAEPESAAASSARDPMAPPPLDFAEWGM
jgi:hypothetical protein